MVVFGDDASGLELDVGDAHSVFYEHDVLRSGVENVKAAIFVPFGWRRLPGFFVLKQLDGHVAEWRVGKVLGNVGEIAGAEAGFAVLQLEGGGWFAFDIVFHLRVTKRDKEVVVVVPVHEGFAVGRDFYFKDANIFVLESLMMARLGGDLDFVGGLGGGEDDRGKKDGGEASSDFHVRE